MDGWMDGKNEDDDRNISILFIYKNDMHNCYRITIEKGCMSKSSQPITFNFLE